MKIKKCRNFLIEFNNKGICLTLVLVSALVLLSLVAVGGNGARLGRLVLHGFDGGGCCLDLGLDLGDDDLLLDDLLDGHLLGVLALLVAGLVLLDRLLLDHGLGLRGRLRSGLLSDDVQALLKRKWKLVMEGRLWEFNERALLPSWARG